VGFHLGLLQPFFLLALLGIVFGLDFGLKSLPADHELGMGNLLCKLGISFEL